ncbi:hypothetical protein C6502_15605 [Candidatus Poribacteria bacterium]|nr:MAG: hypothetical protein C6502_15605 [Candidatus Poribacteria bacterium]
MALDGLQGVIERLQDKIKTHHSYLSGHETRTRQVLIDPLLQELGWDVSDPEAVQLEYAVKLEYKKGKKWADYTLMFKDESRSDDDPKPVAVIEAKPLGSDLEDDKMIQVLNYANRDGIKYMIVTDGDRWEMYEVFKPTVLEERLLMRFQLSQQLPHRNALQALGMWKPNLASDGGLSGAAEPVFTSSDSTSHGSIDKPDEEQALDEENGPPPKGRKKPPTCLVVTMPNGEKIDYDNAMKTFTEVIEKLGINQVRRVYPSLLSTSESRTHGYKIGQYYIRHRTGTKTKKRMLEKVARGLGVQLQVEIVPKN